MHAFGAMPNEIRVLPLQLAFESTSRHRICVAPNAQWARAMIRGICAARSDRFTPLVDVSQIAIVRL